MIKFSTLFKHSLNSSVARDNETERQLLSLLNFKNQKWRLIYRATENGFGASDFHNHCDGHTNTLTLIRTTNESILGGYNGEKWSSNAGFVSDPYAFVFSLTTGHDSKEFGFVAKCLEPDQAIYCKPNLGPAYGKNDITIADLSNQNKMSKSVLTSYQRDQQDDDQDIFLADSLKFQTSEIEVYCKDYKELTNV